MAANAPDQCDSQMQTEQTKSPQVIAEPSLLTKPKNPHTFCGHQLIFFQILKWYCAHTVFKFRHTLEITNKSGDLESGIVSTELIISHDVDKIEV